MLNKKQKSGIGKWKNLIRDEVHILKPYIPGKSVTEVKKEYGLEKVIKMASNENPLGVSEKVQETIRMEAGNINRYPDVGSNKLRRRLGRKLNIDQDMIAFGNGSDGLLKVIAESFLTKNSQVIISHPSFVEYKFVSQLMGSQLVRIMMRNYKHNLEGMADSVDSNTRMVFLANPHNPTGSIFTQEELKTMLEYLPDDVIVVVDEAYHEYVQDNSYPKSIQLVKEGYPVIVLRTFSKAYGLAGLRLGYAVASPGIIETLMRVRDPFNVNHLAEMAGVAALDDEEFLQETIDTNERGKIYLYNQLDEMGLSYAPTHANFLLIKVDKLDSIELFHLLQQKGIIVRPGKMLGYRNHIRVSIGQLEENRAFIRELKNILKDR